MAFLQGPKINTIYIVINFQSERDTLRRGHHLGYNVEMWGFVCLLICLQLFSVLTVKTEAWVIWNRMKTTSMLCAERVVQRKENENEARWD